MTIKSQTRELKPAALRAAVTADTARRTVDVVWTTGAAVLRQDFEGPFYEELSLAPGAVKLDRLNNGAPFLADHFSGDVSGQLGVVERAWVENGKGLATVRFSAEGIDPNADTVFKKIVDGIIQNVSVGYRTWAAEKVPGDAAIPTYRSTLWEPFEISAVSIGADDGAGFRSLNSNVCKLERNHMTPEELAAAQAAQVKAATDAAVTAERERAAGIQLAVRSAKLDDTLSAKMIADGTSLNDARALVLNELARKSEEAPTAAHVRVQVTDDAKDKFQRGASAWLFQRAGNGLIEAAQAKNIKGFEKIELDPGEFRGMTLLDLAKESLVRSGVSIRGLGKMEIVARAFTQRSGGFASTGDFPILFENVMHKLLLAAYATTPDTWSLFCKTETVSDFRDSNRYRTSSLGSLEVVNENGEFKHMSIPDGEKVAINVQTKGGIIAISRQTIINDDMSALTSLAEKLGRGARRGIEEDVYDLLALNSGLGPTQSDTHPFFHSNRANVNGTGSALSVAGIDADRVVMAAQTDVGGNDYLDIRPSVLLVASGLGAAARVINNSAFNHDSTKLQQPNAVQGLFRTIVDTPRLSGTRRYLFSDPSVAPAMCVAFLEGQGQGPVIETKLGWDVDGTEMKVRMDYKAQMLDPKGAVTNAGA